MAKSKIIEVNDKIADTAVSIYKKIENGAVNGYKKIEDTVVGEYKKIENKFVDSFLTHDGESVEEAKKRLEKERLEREQNR